MHRTGWTEFLFGLLAGAAATSFALSAYLDYSGANVSAVTKALAAILGAALGGTLTPCVVRETARPPSFWLEPRCRGHD